MRALGVAFLLMAPALLAAPASALSCLDPTGWAAWFTVHDMNADAAIAVIPVERPSHGTECGFGNAHALSGDRFAWVEPPAAWTSPHNQPWALHVETLSTGAHASVGLPSGRPLDLSIVGDRVLVAMDGPSFFLADPAGGWVVPVAGEAPTQGGFALEGGWIEWLDLEGDHRVLRCRDATRDAPAERAALALPSTPDFRGIGATEGRWLVLEDGAGAWAHDRASGETTSVPLVPAQDAWESGYVEHELDGDRLYLQDNTGRRHMGRGGYHAVALPDGVLEPFAPGGSLADGFDADGGRVVLRSLAKETHPPQPPRPEPAAEPPARGSPCGDGFSLAGVERAVPAGGFVLLALALAARVRSRPSRR